VRAVAGPLPLLDERVERGDVWQLLLVLPARVDQGDGTGQGALCVMGKHALDPFQVHL